MVQYHESWLTELVRTEIEFDCVCYIVSKSTVSRSVAKIWSLRHAVFVLKLLRDWNRNRALTGDIACTLKIYFLILLLSSIFIIL